MRKYKLSNTANLYHLSIDRHDDAIFEPRIPDNRAGFEDNTIPRICVSTSIRGCLKALCMDGTHCSAYIYTPIEYNRNKIADNLYKPTIYEVPDVIETREKWITCPVKMHCIGVVTVEPYRYGWGHQKDKVTIHWDKNLIN